MVESVSVGSYVGLLTYVIGKNKNIHVHVTSTFLSQYTFPIRGIY